ncbi:hypothetical protein COCVIDRAFT_55476, partial [Bipolaris victoriae FI3]
FGRRGAHNRCRVRGFLFRTRRPRTDGGPVSNTLPSFALELIRYRFAPDCTTIPMNYLSYSYITSNYPINAGR